MRNPVRLGPRAEGVHYVIGQDRRMATVSVMVVEADGPTGAVGEARLRAEVEVHAGVDEGAVGEGRLFAFAGARDALRCAVAVQRGAAGDGEPATRMRMAVHSGEGERDNGALRGVSC